MRGNNNFFIIFSGDRGKYWESDKVNRQIIKDAFKAQNIPFKTVQGVYRHALGGKTVHEQSYVVHAKHEHVVLELATKTGQESVLFVDSDSNARLIFLDNNKVLRLGGKFKVIPKEDALKLYAYTHDTDNDLYYGVV